VSRANAATETRFYRGLPLWLACEYLTCLGGSAQADSQITGDGWRAVLTDAPDIVMGVVRLGQIQITFEGDPAALARLLGAFEKKALRAGG
jgi:hypothetical protein